MARSFLVLAVLCAAGCAIESEADGDEDPEVIPASESELNATSASLRLMTYNIKHGKVVGLELSKIADVIKLSNPDIVGLQEVDEGTRRSKGQRQTDELSALTNMPYRYYAPAMNFDGGMYGVAILSKFPITASATVRLDAHTRSENGVEPRVAAVADIKVNDQTVTFVTMHASLHVEERKATGPKLLSALGARAPRAIITGDFNEKPSSDIGDSLAGAGFVDAYNEKHSLFGFTSPANIPLRRIDFIYRAKTMGKTLHGWVPSTKASDHRPVGTVIPLR